MRYARARMPFIYAMREFKLHYFTTINVANNCANLSMKFISGWKHSNCFLFNWWNQRKWICIRHPRRRNCEFHGKIYLAGFIEVTPFMWILCYHWLIDSDYLIIDEIHQLVTWTITWINLFKKYRMKPLMCKETLSNLVLSPSFDFTVENE